MRVNLNLGWHRRISDFFELPGGEANSARCRMANPPSENAMVGVSGDFHFVKRLPVIQVVEIDRIGRAPVGKTRGFQDISAGIVIVLISGECGIELGDSGLIELGSGVRDKFLKSDVGGLFRHHEADQGIAIHAKRVQRHHIVSRAAIRVAVRELAGGGECHFLP